MSSQVFLSSLRDALLTTGTLSTVRSASVADVAATSRGTGAGESVVAVAARHEPGACQLKLSGSGSSGDVSDA